MRRRATALSVLLAAAAPRAAAADDGQRFFAEEPAKAGEPKTLIDGSLTSSSFLYRESSAVGELVDPNGERAEVGSTVSRMFTDLRAQLSARRIGGGKLALRADLRGRFVATATNAAGDATLQNPERTVPVQSGMYGDQELEIRELYAKRDGDEVDVFVGRKFSLELAAVRFDGIEIQRRSSARWTTIGFAGLYPVKGSRDLRDDYPVGLEDPSDAESGPKRIMPVTGGVGGAYRTERAWGAIGAVVIAPLANDRIGKLEEPRSFATANGYWRASQKLDLFHYVVVDATGAAGAGLTNLTLGAGWQPRQGLRLAADVNQVDTETLDVQAQTRLSRRDEGVGTSELQNDIEVSRVAQQSARLGLSLAMARNRFEVSTSGTLRRRGALSLPLAGPDADARYVLGAGKAVDLMASVVDRRSWRGVRLQASVVHSFSIGHLSLDRTTSTVARLQGVRSIDGGRAELEANLAYLTSRDDNTGQACTLPTLDTLGACYGAAKVTGIEAGAVGFYRFDAPWFILASLTVGRQSITSSYEPDTAIAQPAILVASAFLRLAYRF